MGCVFPKSLKTSESHGFPVAGYAQNMFLFSMLGFEAKKYLPNLTARIMSLLISFLRLQYLEPTEGKLLYPTAQLQQPTAEESADRGQGLAESGCFKSHQDEFRICNYNLELPPTQDSSHHQDDITFLIGNPNLNLHL